MANRVPAEEPHKTWFSPVGTQFLSVVLGNFFSSQNFFPERGAIFDAEGAHEKRLMNESNRVSRSSPT